MSPAARFPTALVLALVLFGASERLGWSRPGLLRFASVHTPGGSRGDPLRIHARIRTRPAGPPLLALFGSSQVIYGLDCSALAAARPGADCLNLATNGGAPTDMLYVAGDLDARAPRRLTVAALTPATLWGPFKPPLFGGAGLRCLAQSGAFLQFGLPQWDDVLLSLALRLSPTLRFKEGVSDLLDLFWHYPKLVWKGRMSPPPELEPEHPGRPWPDLSLLLPADRPDEAAFALQRAAFFRFLQHEREAGNRVLLVDIPTSEPYEAALPAYVAAGLAEVLARVREDPNVRILARGSLPPFARADFRDPVHLSRAGRRKLSAAVAQEVAALP